jgi:hypothetical protein
MTKRNANEPIGDSAQSEPPTPSSIMALTKRLASIVDEKDEDLRLGGSAADAERTRFLNFLLEIAQFFKDAPIDLTTQEEAHRRMRLLWYMNRVMSSVQQLGEGVPHPMWTPKNIGAGRKPDPRETWVARRFVCAALECYMRGRGIGREAAADIIARSQPTLARLLRDADESITKKRTRDKLGSAIVSWHRLFQNGEVDEFENRHWADTMDALQEASRLPGFEKQDWTWCASTFLRMARDEAALVILPLSKKSPVD